MQFSGIEIFYKSIGDIQNEKFSLKEKIERGLKMSDDLRVNATGAYNVSGNYAKKDDYDFRQIVKDNDELSRQLTGDKQAQKARQNDLASNYMSFSKITALYDFDKDGITDKVERKQITAKNAGKAAKNQVKNELAYEKVQNTVVYWDKAEYDANKKADKKAGLNPQYIKDKDVRNYIDNNRHLFFDENGNFSQDMYKDEVVNWTGADWKLNLDERRALAHDGQTDHLDKGSAKKMAQYGGFEIQKDYTNLKRAGVIAGSLAAAVGMAYAFPKITEVDAQSIVNILHENGVTDFNVSELKAKMERKSVNPTAALAAALPPAILAASLIKEKTDKDIFTETEAARIVLEENGTKRVMDENGNREIVQAIKDLPNLTDDQKIMALMYGYGQGTGKKVNERELIAAYEAAKAVDDYIAEHGQIDPNPNPEPDVEPVPVPVPTPDPDPIPDTDPEITPVPIPDPEPTPEPEPTPQPEPQKPAQVIVENGESIAMLAKKYGVSAKEIMELNKDQLKNFKSATDCQDDKKYLGFLVGAKIKLPAGANEEAVKENQKTTSEKEYGKYKKASVKLDTKLCDDRTKTYKPLDEGFRKEQGIRTVGEYEAELAAQESEKIKVESDEDFRKKNPFIARPDDTTPAYEPPKFEAPKTFVPSITEQKTAAKKAEAPKTQPQANPKPQVQEQPKAENKPMPSIQELTDAAKARRDAQKPWYQFW